MDCKQNFINYCLYAHRANGDVVGAHLCVRPFYRFHKIVGADIIRPLLNGTEFKTLPSFRSATENPPPLSGEASKLNNNLPNKKAPCNGRFVVFYNLVPQYSHFSSPS